MDDVGIDRLAPERAVKIHDMKPSGPCLHPAPGHFHGPVRKHRDILHVALPQAYAFAVFEINCRYQEHVSEPLSNE